MSNYLGGVIKKGLSFIKQGKIADSFAHAYDMLDVYRNYGKDNENEVQQRMLKKVLKYANKHCSYYREIGKTLKDPLDIKQYPFINKKIIRDNFDGIVSDNKDKMLYNIARTSGSTGQPLEFFNGNGLDDYFQFQVWKKHGWESGDKILSMFGIKIKEEDVKNNIFWQDKPEYSTSQGGYNLSALYLNEENKHIYVDYILKLKPNFIRAFPSFVTEIARYILDNNIEIDFKVKGVELTSETSYQEQWDVIEKAFKTKVFFQYGHTETCVFAYSYDDTKKLRVEPLYGYVEILDEQGNQVKEGEIGEVTVTTLHNYVMPFIRYRIGDMAEFGGYDGKYMILNKIIGRSYDYLVNKEGTKINFTAFLAEHHMKALGNIEKWQFEQFEKGKAIIKLVKGKNYNNEDEKEIINFFRDFGKTDIEIEYVNDIEKTNRGKTKIVIQHIEN